MNGWIIAGVCLAPSATIAALLIAAAMNERRRDRDARRRAEQFQHAMRVRLESLAEARIRVKADALRDDLDRFAELCAWFQPQAEEIASLPVVDPYWRRLPNGWQR